MNEAEGIIKGYSDYAGIGVGLFSDYGVAQRLYVKSGYIPDGKGIYKHDSYINYNETVNIDDDVVLYFIKLLK